MTVYSFNVNGEINTDGLDDAINLLILTLEDITINGRVEVIDKKCSMEETYGKRR